MSVSPGKASSAMTGVAVVPAMLTAMATRTGNENEAILHILLVDTLSETLKLEYKDPWVLSENDAKSNSALTDLQKAINVQT